MSLKHTSRLLRGVLYSQLSDTNILNYPWQQLALSFEDGTKSASRGFPSLHHIKGRAGNQYRRREKDLCLAGLKRDIPV